MKKIRTTKALLSACLALMMLLSMTATAFAGTVTENDMSNLKGAIGYISPMQVSSTTDKLFWRGIRDQLSAWGDYNLVDMSPAEFKASQMIDKVEECIAQQVAAIVISPISDAGFDEALRKAMAAGIKVISWNGRANPSCRVTHVNQCNPMKFTEYFLASSVLYTLNVPFDNNPENLVNTAIEAANAAGQDLQIGIISTLPDSAIQNSWIEQLETAVQAYNVNITFEIKYTNNDIAQGAPLIDAFDTMPDIKAVICLASTTTTTCAEEILQLGSDMKLTGCMWPGTIVDYLPTSLEDQLDSVIPYGLGWDFEVWGQVVGATVAATLSGEYDGSIGSVVEVKPTALMPEGATYETVPSTKASEAEAGGTEVMSQLPVVFTCDNIEKYVEQENSVAN